MSVGRHKQQNILQTRGDRIFVGRNTYSTVVKENLVNMVEKKPFQRLPTTVKPKHYTLTLTPDLKALTFKGEVSIHIEVCIMVLLYFVCAFKLFVVDCWSYIRDTYRNIVEH